MSEFEYDPKKSANNLIKHGIDFQEAQKLWGDINLVEIPAKVEGEPRSLLIGKLQGKHWSAVITYRENKVRIISVRRSRKLEVELYENK